MTDIPKIQFLEDIARSSGRILMKHLFKLTKGQIRFKGQNDYVTVVDQLSEKMIIKKILSRFPDHQIMAEETAHTGQWDPNKPLWIIDPIFCVSIAFQIRGKIVLGVVFDPNRNELFSAIRGRGAYLNGKKIKVSQTKNIDLSLLATGFPFRYHEILEPYIRIFRALCQNSKGIRRGGSAALDLCYVACGRFDGFWEFNLLPWDMAAGSLIVREAQGLISNFQGNPLELKRQNVLAGNRFIYKQLNEVVEQALK
jgi:myo-inositol-1(or 4)-monophosphatase